LRQWTDEELHFRGYLARVESHLMARPASGEEFDTTPTLGDALAMYTRCRSLFAAIRLLVERGYPEESVILGRSVFETSLQLEYLAGQDGPGRESLLIQRRIDGAKQTEDLIDQRLHLGLGPGLRPAEADVLATQRRPLHARQERLEIKRTRRFPSPKDLARKLGHLDEYLDYLLASELTHGSTISQATRSRHPAPNTVHIYARSDNEAVLVGAGLFGARAALRTLRACEVIFDWAHDGTQELLDEAADGNDVARAPGD